MNSKAVVVVGVGSPHGDDQVGWEVIEKLKVPLLGHLQLRILRSPIELLYHLESVHRLHVVDAFQIDDLAQHSNPGGIVRLSWPTEQMQTFRWTNTHDLCLPAVLELAQILKLLPKTVVVWGIEGKVFGPGTQPSYAMQEWAKSAAILIRSELTRTECLH